MQSTVQHKIPVVIGRNRLRGNSQGAMIDDEYGDGNLARMRQILREQAGNGGITENIKEWVDNSVRTLLKMYEESHAQWQSDKQEAVGHIFEAEFPSGVSLLMGDRRILARI